MSTLQRAIEIAVTAHNGQVDKAGAPYVLHPLRVMHSLRAESIETQIVGVLHDVVEDCDGWTFERLGSEGFSAEVIEALRAVTKLPEEEHAQESATTPEEKFAAYEAFVLRAAKNAIGRRVKLADLQDNCDLSRIAESSAKDYARIERYERAIARLASDGK
jgi:(p)ppGpp synthase/HD superfamily hydrolase